VGPVRSDRSIVYHALVLALVSTDLGAQVLSLPLFTPVASDSIAFSVSRAASREELASNGPVSWSFQGLFRGLFTSAQAELGDEADRDAELADWPQMDLVVRLRSSPSSTLRPVRSACGKATSPTDWPRPYVPQHCCVDELSVHLCRLTC
jgi:hypothetical protein